MTEFTANLLFNDASTGDDITVVAVSAADAAATVKRDITFNLAAPPTSIVVFEGRSVTNFDYRTLEATFSA